MKKILLVAGAALALAGCGEKGEFEKAINAKIGQDKYCFSLDNNNTSFPIRLAKPRLDSTGTGTNSVILDGFIEQGLMVFEQGYDSNVLGITEEGKQLPRIRHTNYFLITVSRLSPFLNLVNSTTTNTGTVCCAPDFGFFDVPNWIDKKAFASVKGMNEPADGAMNLFKTSNGWKAN
ncbi:lipoprotein [Salmonella enterica]|nr:lipoprotein [Salmonella enterica]ELV7833831.1 lipoprotein [Salmonella enterica]ELW3740010.1 lipoprotein [Salmonella enterica]ELW3759910.1 lipoprotein [Salmonella enterica]